MEKFLIIADTDQLGSSGVGDYALLLAQSLREKNLTVYFQALGPPSHLSSSALAQCVSQVKPDWVSFHFVPYAYAHRGMVGKATLPWQKLCGRLGTHILFHEIWIGAYQGASWRQRTIGFFQQLGIQQVLYQLKPDVVHCTNPLYSAMLDKAGIPNRVLPLFGAVPVLRNYSLDPYLNLLPIFVPGSSRSDWTVVAFFGKIYHSNFLLPALQWLKTKCLSNGKRLLIVSLGYCPSAVSIFRELAPYLSQPSSSFFHVTGKLDTASLSSWIRGADCGLSTTPFNIIDKSSSAVTFVEHGIPVIVADRGAPIRGIDYTLPDLAPEFWLFGDKRLEELQSLPPRREPNSRKDRVVQQFLADLNIYDH